MTARFACLQLGPSSSGQWLCRSPTATHSWLRHGLGFGGRPGRRDCGSSGERFRVWQTSWMVFMPTLLTLFRSMTCAELEP
eukprot:s5916_g4.t1